MSEPVITHTAPTHIETAADNPTLIKPAVQNLLIEPLQAASVVLSLPGVRIVDSATPVIFPTLNTQDVDPKWYGQGEEIVPQPDLDFGELTLMPADLASIKVLSVVSNELIRQANAVNIEQVLRNKLVGDVTHKLDNALLAGNGSATTGGAKTVKGLLSLATNTVKADPGTPDGILAGVAAMAAKEVKPTVALVSGADWAKIAGLKDADGRYLVQPDATKAMGYTLFGVPLVVSNKVPAGQMLLLDASNVVIVRDVNADVAVLKERFAEYDSTGIRTVSRFDIGLLRPEAAFLVKAA